MTATLTATQLYFYIHHLAALTLLAFFQGSYSDLLFHQLSAEQNFYMRRGCDMTVKTVSVSNDGYSEDVKAVFLTMSPSSRDSSGIKGSHCTGQTP